MSQSKHEIVLTNLPLGIRFYESNVDSSGYVPFHWHNSVEVLCVLEGTLQLFVNARSHTIRDGECIAISSGMIHDVANTPNRTLVLQIPLRILSPFVSAPQLLHFHVSKNKNAKAYEHLVNQFMQMNQIIRNKKEGYLFDSEITLIKILKLLVLYFTEKEPLQSRISSNIQDLLIYINEHYKEPLSVQNLAKIVGYNANYLSRIFHTQMGTTLNEYIYRVRLTHFREALFNTDSSIKELMLECGLKNQRTTREIFQKIYGTLPLEARKNNQM